MDFHKICGIWNSADLLGVKGFDPQETYNSLPLKTKKTVTVSHVNPNRLQS